MNLIRNAMLVLALAVMLASPALAQRQRPGAGPPGGQFPGRGGPGFGPGMGMQMGGLGLLAMPAVQQELNLEEDQISQVLAATEAQRAQLQGLRDLAPEQRLARMEEAREKADATVAELLNEEQRKRFEQIQHQQAGLQALLSPEIQEQLELSDDQKQSIEKIARSAAEEMASLRQDRPRGDFQAMAEQMTAIRSKSMEQAVNVLSDSQQEKWNDLLGEPFELPAFGGPRGGRGPGGAGAPGGRGRGPGGGGRPR